VLFEGFGTADGWTGESVMFRFDGAQLIDTAVSMMGHSYVAPPAPPDLHGGKAWVDASFSDLSRPPHAGTQPPNDVRRVGVRLADTIGGAGYGCYYSLDTGGFNSTGMGMIEVEAGDPGPSLEAGLDSTKPLHVTLIVDDVVSCLITDGTTTAFTSTPLPVMPGFGLGSPMAVSEGYNAKVEWIRVLGTP
jgi:hypothetical protein